MIWQHYPDIESTRRLKYSGDELIKKEIYFTEKRDGSNISFWFNNDDNWISFLKSIGVMDEVIQKLDKYIHISSHNQENLLSPKVYENIVNTESYNGIAKYIHDMQESKTNLIVYAELMQKGKTPTQVEPIVETPELFLFDILDVNKQEFLPFEKLQEISGKYNINMVRLVEKFKPTSKEELKNKVEQLMDWCKEEKREGVVGKVYTSPQVFFKEKIIVPKPPKEHKEKKERLPEMDEHTKKRAVEHTIDELLKICEEKNLTLKQAWEDRKLTMPILVKHIRLEAREHGFEEPNAYRVYLNVYINEYI